MQHTKVVASLKNIFPPIHAPASLSKNDSQRLLDSIKTSFRRQLDLEYGWASPNRNTVLPLTKSGLTFLPPNAAASKASPVTPPSTPQDNVSSSHATDRHMHAILHNPLLKPAAATNTTADVLEIHSGIFEKAVARGLMTIPRAQGFLMVVKSHMKKHKSVWLTDALKPTGAGLLVLRWLRSSGLETSLEFLNNAPFRQLLLQFLVAEGLDGVVWSWFDQLLKEQVASGLLDKHSSRAGFLLGDLVKVKSCGSELEGAYAAMVEAQRMVLQRNAPADTLYQAWSALAWETTLDSTNRTKPSVELFDAFVAMGASVRPPKLERAHINLHHPVDPSAGLALRFLSSNDAFMGVPPKSAQKSWDPASGRPAALDRYIYQLKFLGLDTIQYLKQTDNHLEAVRLWNRLQKNLVFFTAYPSFVWN